MRIAYRVTNARQSSADLASFAVDAQPLATRMDGFGSGSDVDVHVDSLASVARWRFLRPLTPGAVSPTLAFAGIGLPGVVRYRAASTVTRDSSSAAASAATDSGFTVGIVPFPADRSRGALGVRVVGLILESCARSWIDDRKVCDRLFETLLQEDDRAVVRELDAQRGRHVNELAYLLIASNMRALPPRESEHSRPAQELKPPDFDPALVQEQQRRIAAYDSVVRTINTDSVYKLWRWSLTLPDPKVGQQQVQCEIDQMMFHYGGAASMAALRRMEDTLWRGVDPQQIARLRRGLKGMSLPITRAICGPRTTEKAPYWLREWYIYPLPQLPPSPTDSAPRLP